MTGSISLLSPLRFVVAESSRRATNPSHNLTGATRILTAGVVLVTIQLALGTDQTNAPAPPKPIGRHVQPDLSKWDLNRNGKLDPGEVEAWRRDQIKQRHDEMQRHVEELNAKAKAEAEMARLQEAARRSNAIVVPNGFWRQFDTNGNGVLDPEERAAYRKALADLKARQQAAEADARSRKQQAGTTRPSASAPPPQQSTTNVTR